MRGNTTIALRPATAADTDITFAWQADSRTRHHFHDPRPPTRTKHDELMAAKFDDRDALFLIVLENDDPAGVLRLDPAADDSFEVSILVAPERHGHGIGKAALAEARNLRPAANLKATVLPGNDASHALFRAAGYLTTDGKNYVHRPFDGRAVVVLHPDGADAGMGHARRLAGLAQALRDADLAPLFLTAPESGLEHFLEQHGLSAFQCDGNPDDLVRTMTGTCAFVVDHYRLDVGSLSAAANGRFPIIAFDDTGDHGLAADMIVNGSPAAETLEYSKRTKARLLLGPDYQIVRGDLVRRDRDPGGEPSRLLVCIGGGDPLGIGPDLLNLLEDTVAPAYPRLAIDYVAGPQAPAPTAKTDRIRLHHTPGDMAALISKADVAVSGGGQTLFELLYCGVPTVALRLADNQQPNIDALAGLGCIHDAGRADEAGWLETLEAALGAVLDDEALRRELSGRGRALIDGRGGDRIASEIAEFLGHGAEHPVRETVS